MLSTTIAASKTAVFDHPDFGLIPVKVILDCVFALSPSGEILHHHAEEFDVDDNDGTTLFRMNGTPPLESRARCQVIPPRIPEFLT
ncbi:MAG: hypothetical protein AAF387_08360 [Pseudomonadota bacterium]